MKKEKPESKDEVRVPVQHDENFVHLDNPIWKIWDRGKGLLDLEGKVERPPPQSFILALLLSHAYLEGLAQGVDVESMVNYANNAFDRRAEEMEILLIDLRERLGLQKGAEDALPQD